jgi:hypothetical protein
VILLCQKMMSSGSSWIKSKRDSSNMCLVSCIMQWWHRTFNLTYLLLAPHQRSMNHVTVRTHNLLVSVLCNLTNWARPLCEAQENRITTNL